MKVTAILKGMIDSNGHQPVQIRISQGKDRSFRPTGIKLSPSLFEKGRVKKEHPKYKEYNKKIETLIIQYQAEALTGLQKRKPKINFFDYTKEAIRHLERDSGTLRYYSSQITKLKSFRSSFYLSDVDKTFLNNYKAYLKSIGNEGNTIWAAFKFLRTFLRMALMDRLIENYPFHNYEFPSYIEPYKNYLTENEVKQWDKFCFSKKCTPALFEAGVWFLIGCYTGLRISDIKSFDKNKNVVGNRLVFHTVKTGEIVGLPISKRLKKYFQAVGYQPLSIHENTYNKLIKVVAAAAGIEKHISSHTARHTAAMLLANAEVSLEVTAKILGQASTKSTEVYYKISNKRIDAEMKKVK